LERLQRGSAREHDQDNRHQDRDRDRDLVAQLQERERDLEMQLEDREHEILELRRAQDSAERNEDDTIDHNASRHVRELHRMRAENEELRRQLEERDQLLIQRENEIETLADRADRLQLEGSSHFVRLLRICSRHERHISTGTHRLPTRDETRRHSGETLKWLLMHVAMLQGDLVAAQLYSGRGLCPTVG
jgi:predicted RNase H-like nuclease (RuvC/YqgF family)